MAIQLVEKKIISSEKERFFRDSTLVLAGRENGVSKKNVYLGSLENFHTYGWVLGTCIRQKDEFGRFLIHNADSAGNA